MCDVNDDFCVELLFDDGIVWIKNCELGSLDVIIIDSIDLVGLAEGLFVVDFYCDCFKVLKMEGILV